jgi:uncharacterized membrane protein
MKTKIIYLVILALIILFPFRYAFLDARVPNAFTVLSMVAVVIGALTLILLNTSDKEKLDGSDRHTADRK